jgi:hypothetical protein
MYYQQRAEAALLIACRSHRHRDGKWFRLRFVPDAAQVIHKGILPVVIN